MVAELDVQTDVLDALIRAAGDVERNLHPVHVLDVVLLVDVKRNV